MSTIITAVAPLVAAGVLTSSDGYPWDGDTSKAGWALTLFGVALLVVIVVVVLVVVVRRRRG